MLDLFWVLIELIGENWLFLWKFGLIKYLLGEYLISLKIWKFLLLKFWLLVIGYFGEI